MKQASFKIGEVDNEKINKVSNALANDVKNDVTNDLKNITSKKPIKVAENIYYFSSPKPNTGNM
jgi:hypothetical protein